ncbi:HNH endonuclease [Acinetobacter baumannii]|uniref:HNH endonuclease n=1 Tax=Acinetobacter baumannii TaxID=470 RepID=UPI0025A0043F|nr:HNH endonuclease [Acinetobacter baumannii]
MSSNKNKFGLQRAIELPKKRTIRQRDNFGCIICSFPIIQYEHVDPLFCDAREHIVDGITLLCPNCHQKVTNGWISKEMVKEAMENPKASDTSLISDTLHFTRSHPTVKIGGATFEKCKTILRFRGQDLFSISQDSGKYFLNFKFWDSKGKQNLTISDNEWQAQVSNIWDLEVVANRVTVREKERKPSLVFSLTNNNILTIEKIDMVIDGLKIIGNEDTLQVDNDIYEQCDMSECGICFDIY